MTDLPDGWRALTPSEVVADDRGAIIIGPFGSNLRTVDYRSSGVPLVFVRDIRQATFNSPSHYVAPEKAAQLSSHLAEPGDVLITKMGDPPGDAAVYNGRVPAVITADCIRMRVPAPHDARYVAYALSAPTVRQQIDHITRGVAQRKVSLARFRSGVTLPMAPPNEQRRIIDILEDHLSRLDAATRALEAQSARLAALRQSALTHARQSLVAEGSRTVRIADMASTNLGKMLDAKRATGTPTPYLRNINVRWGAIDLSDVSEVSLSEEERERFALRPGDLLVCEGGEPGRCAIWPGSAALMTYQKALHRVRFAETTADPRYVALMLEQVIRSGGADKLITGTTIKHLPQEKLRLITIPLPPVERQQAVVQEIETLTEAAAALEYGVTIAKKRAETLRRALLAAAFSGRLTGRASDLDLAEEMVSA